jgi:hypothetical protein
MRELDRAPDARLWCRRSRSHVGAKWAGGGPTPATRTGNVATLDDAVAAFNPTERISGQTIIRVRP